MDLNAPFPFVFLQPGGFVSSSYTLAYKVDVYTRMLVFKVIAKIR